MASLRIQNISKTYNQNREPSIDAVSLDIQDGEFLVMVGPSGCGKSTLLRIIAGLETADIGDIYIDNIRVTKTPPQDRDVAMVFQGYALYPHLSVYDNIEFPLKMQKATNRKKQIQSVAEMLNLSTLLQRYPHQLSGGERQRVAMARAIVRKPKLFLFDEPLSNLDAALRAELRRELSNLMRQLKTTAIYVTHDQAEAMTMGDRIALFRKGRLSQISTPEQMYFSPANTYVAGFLGSPPMNIFETERQEQSVILFGKAISFQTAFTNQLLAGIRPENIQICDPNEPDSFEARIRSIEPLGAETIVTCEINDIPILIKMNGYHRFFPKDVIFIQFPLNQLQWFDRSTGERISLQ